MKKYSYESPLDRARREERARAEEERSLERGKMKILEEERLSRLQAERERPYYEQHQRAYIQAMMSRYGSDFMLVEKVLSHFALTYQLGELRNMAAYEKHDGLLLWMIIGSLRGVWKEHKAAESRDRKGTTKYLIYLNNKLTDCDGEGLAKSIAQEIEDAEIEVLLADPVTEKVTGRYTEISYPSYDRNAPDDDSRPTVDEKPDDVEYY